VKEEYALDWDVDHSGWEELDLLLGSSSAFPELERVEIMLLDSYETKPLLRLEEFTHEIRSRMPQLLERGILRITGEPAVGVSSFSCVLNFILTEKNQGDSFMFIERDSTRMLESLSSTKG
jgi:hypothetical protein